MNEVDPRAEMRSLVLRLSRSPATKMKVATGHQPGKAVRLDQAFTAIAAAATVVRKTNK
jgi:hypothetical protein